MKRRYMMCHECKKFIEITDTSVCTYCSHDNSGGITNLDDKLIDHRFRYNGAKGLNGLDWKNPSRFHPYRKGEKRSDYE
jgi:hypothetical protein